MSPHEWSTKKSGQRVWPRAPWEWPEIATKKFDQLLWNELLPCSIFSTVPRWLLPNVLSLLSLCRWRYGFKTVVQSGRSRTTYPTRKLLNTRPPPHRRILISRATTRNPIALPVHRRIHRFPCNHTCHITRLHSAVASNRWMEHIIHTLGRAARRSTATTITPPQPHPPSTSRKCRAKKPSTRRNPLQRPQLIYPTTIPYSHWWLDIIRSAWTTRFRIVTTWRPVWLPQRSHWVHSVKWAKTEVITGWSCPQCCPSVQWIGCRGPETRTRCSSPVWNARRPNGRLKVVVGNLMPYRVKS